MEDLGHSACPRPGNEQTLEMRVAPAQRGPQGGRMEEDISRPVRELDEPVPLGGVEPFDFVPEPVGQMSPSNVAPHDAAGHRNCSPAGCSRPPQRPAVVSDENLRSFRRSIS